MHIVHTLEDLRRVLAGATLRALVPTMGNLHEGHLQLMRLARAEADRRAPQGALTVASIFVNRLQFGPNEDFDTYPRTLDNDCALLAKNGCDVVFAPSEQDLYPEPQGFKVHPPAELADILEGAFRPGFFVGVSTVVHKLFNILQPDVAVFGKKDYQQLMVIRQMVRQMALPIDIVGAETCRADDGLALSSRNGYLNAEQRAIAPALYQSLQWLKAQLAAGEADLRALEQQTKQRLQEAGFRPDYLNISNQLTLEPAKLASEPLVVLAAAYLGATRLIDNIEI